MVENLLEKSPIFSQIAATRFFGKILAASLFRPRWIYGLKSQSQRESQAINKFTDNPRLAALRKTHLSNSAVDEVVLEVPDQGVPLGEHLGRLQHVAVLLAGLQHPQLPQMHLH